MVLKLFNNVYPSLQSKLILFVGLFSVLYFYKKSSLKRSTCALIAILINAYLIDWLVHGKCGFMAWLYILLNVMGTLVIITGTCG
jgi:hypothetical protein